MSGNSGGLFTGIVHGNSGPIVHIRARVRAIFCMRVVWPYRNQSTSRHVVGGSCFGAQVVQSPIPVVDPNRNVTCLSLLDVVPQKARRISGKCHLLPLITYGNKWHATYSPYEPRRRRQPRLKSYWGCQGNLSLMHIRPTTST